MPNLYLDTQTNQIVDGTSVERSLSRRRRYRPLNVPDGNVDEVLEWAGDDPDRRAMALAAERADKQRKGVIEALEG